MSFFTYNASPTGKTGGGSSDGIYISKATVLGVTDRSGQQNGNRTDDISLELKLQVEGVSFEPKMFISGNFKYNERNEVVGIGSVFKVLDFISTVTGLTQVLVDKDLKQIPESFIQELVGKEFYRLTYRSGVKPDGKYKYKTWPVAGSHDSNPEDLRALFLKKHAAEGYPRDYMKEIPDPNKPPF